MSFNLSEFNKEAIRIQIVLHYMLTNAPYPNLTSPYQSIIQNLLNDDILCINSSEDNSFYITPKGEAYLKILAYTPYPTIQYIDQNGNTID